MRYFSYIYVLLLVYIIAALVFWGLSLHKNSKKMYEQDVYILNSSMDSLENPTLYEFSHKELETKMNRRTSQYIGEGSTFLLIILIGAAVVYSSFKRNLRLSRQQNNFMLSVTHELKSPIAAVKLNLQTMERHHLDEQKRNMLIERCIKETNRLNDLCNNMLLASQIEGRQYNPTKEKIDFSELVDESMKDYTTRYPTRFQEGMLDESILLGDRLMLQMAVNNLLENAIKYTPADKLIHVSLTKTGKTAVLQVKDEGLGIPDNEKQKIFNKFYRVGNEETRRSKGTGLGLYLTSKIVKQHKGKILVKDNVPNGAIFEVCLPVS